MTLQELFVDSDPAVKGMVARYLMDGRGADDLAPGLDSPWIQQFLDNFDSERGTWGGGIYGPKWTSTFYTLRDLLSLEIDPNHPIYQRGLRTLVDNMWNKAAFVEDDVCVVAMLVSMLTYGKWDRGVVDEMMGYLADQQMPDGGWNCAITYKKGNLHHSSIHTTLAVLEAYRDYMRYGYNNGAGTGTGAGTVETQTKEGQAYLLRKHLMRRETNGEIIKPSIVQFHFPTRWQYDVLRALCYFESVKHPYDPRMAEALQLVKDKIKRGYVGKGPTYTGRLHFVMEGGKMGSMNTLRALIVLKHFDPHYYKQLWSTAC